jgi:hypothetical protein
MANKKQGWLQKAKRQMEKKGTVGAFTEYCGHSQNTVEVKLQDLV